MLSLPKLLSKVKITIEVYFINMLEILWNNIFLRPCQSKYFCLEITNMFLLIMLFGQTDMIEKIYVITRHPMFFPAFFRLFHSLLLLCWHIKHQQCFIPKYTCIHMIPVYLLCSMQYSYNICAWHKTITNYGFKRKIKGNIFSILWAMPRKNIHWCNG